ncbi:lin-9 -like protein [Brachionus plicatilis]|uniref:Lin-9-like protein n=1 Tax=Brachionus plicatilis TaxID=10195 RepID=A0A3M7SZY3_BRAPC|nr:lin-9 -like protein [Brachionus plicatilis]
MSSIILDLDDKSEIIKKLSNFLKLPKAQRWICCEWFYSDIDRVIFESENDFTLCMKQSFPRLRAQTLTRKQWCMVRSLIGKPRRCSSSFFQEERQMIEEKRQKIRLIQQRKISESEIIDLKDLPQEIPVTLSIGHRVYTHICHPEEGVFLGTIAAVDPVEHTYRVVFDRSNIGSLTVHDYEIKSVTPVQTIPTKAYIQTYRPKSIPFSNAANFSAINSQSNPKTSSGLHDEIAEAQLNADPLSELNEATNGRLGCFPVPLLLTVTRLHKILNVKRDDIKRLSELNSEAERLKASNEKYSKEFELSYAEVVNELEKLNKDLNDYLYGVQNYCEEALDVKLEENLFKMKGYYTRQSLELLGSIGNGPTGAHKLEENLNKIKLSEASENEVSQILASKLKSAHLSSLVIKMTSLMLQLKDLASSADKKSSSDSKDVEDFSEKESAPFMSFSVKSLNESIDEIKKSLKYSENVELFEDKVQVQINHIQSVLCNFNRLYAFNCENTNRLNHK